MKQNKSAALLYEIGTEEIPSAYFEGAISSILAKASRLLAECGSHFERLEVHTTPRRFVIHAVNFRRLQSASEEKIGPLKDFAYKEGHPTPVTNAMRAPYLLYKERAGICLYRPAQVQGFFHQ